MEVIYYTFLSTYHVPGIYTLYNGFVSTSHLMLGMVKDKEAWRAVVHGVAKSFTRLTG